EDLPTNSEDVGTEEIVKKEEGTINAVAVLLASNNISANIDIDWKAGESVPYAALVNAYEKIEATSKRLEIQEIMTTFFLRILEKSPDSLLEVIYLCINRICPEFEGLELGIGEASLMKAIAMSTGRKVQAIRKEYSETGDLGLVAKASKKAQSTLFTPKPMTVSSVFKAFRKIALTSGADSIERKVQSIAALMSSCRSGEEAKYLVRSLEGKLRIGLAEATVLISLAQATVMNNSEYKTMSKNDKTAKLAEAPNVLKAVYSELPSYDIIVPVLLKHGVDGLREHCKLTPGIPCKPMLAHPTKSITEVLDRVEGHKFTCEYKYDGERGQIHLLEDGTIKIFSRNLEDNSQKFPDIIKNVARFIKEGTKSFVLDCEVVAWDKEKKSILPFQVLTTRKRKDVKHEDIKVTVCVFGFDILYYNGEPLLQKSLETRRDILFSVFNEVE
ncbi:3338_t:CDS:2, partial [Paraglomus occultum]